MTLLDVFSALWWRDYFLAWLVGVSTAVGVAAAIIAGVYAARAFGREVARDQRREVEDLQGQAAKVTGWTIFKHEKKPNSDEWETEVVVYARNTSDQPIYDASFGVVLDGELLTTIPVGVQPPDQLFAGSQPAPEIVQQKWRGWLAAHDDLESRSEGAILEFRDAAGHKWKRTADGRLHGPLE